MVSPDKVSYEIVGLPCAIVNVSPAIGAPPGDHVPGTSMLYVPLAIQVLAVKVGAPSDDDVGDSRTDGDQGAGHGRRDDVGHICRPCLDGGRMVGAGAGCCWLDHSLRRFR
jgi:hypothetical protein